MRWIRKPPVHFVVIGAILFAIGHHRSAPPRPADRPTLVITATRLAQVRAELGAVTASAPAPDERTLVERAVDDEILYREALARGMDHKDPSVRWRLAEKMRFLGDEETTATPGSEDELYRKAVRLGLDREDAIVRGILVRQMRLLLARVAGEKPPDDAELAGYLERHPDRYVEPGRVTFWHVFLADDRRRAGVTRDAEGLLARLRTDATSPAEAVRLGDVFPPGTRFRGQSAADLTRLFGPDFARATLALEPGRWSGPLRSAYGLHLVKVEEKESMHTPPLDAVRSRVLADVLENRREARLAAALRDLRAKYVVRVEPPGKGCG
ncbi:MAG: peptidyl-prolyl cis-trans isomerase [Deltaproteobacteria bacterium]|nr:MAG: peptidyl-prolyl cis-trans isomerase [Deltaproteobacteria bacterium]